jgi:hypothetical protein
MSDAFFVTLLAGMAALTWGLLVLCDKLLGDQR